MTLPDPPFSLSASYAQIQASLSPSQSKPGAALPSPATALTSANTLHTSLPAHGLGDTPTFTHILQDLVPGFNGPKTSSTYYGFVTGGVFPIAEAADNVVTAWDQNVQVHLPAQSVSTAVEAHALSMLCELLNLRSGSDAGARWQARTFTTGATTSNIIGLSCGREAVLAARLANLPKAAGAEEETSTGALGLLAACGRAGIGSFQILTTMGHSSLSKAASIVGLGRSSVKNIGLPSEPWKFDMEKLEGLLGVEGVASVVVVSCGEVNTGMFATAGAEEMRRIRELCDRFGAWLHVDGAFGLFARALPAGEEFKLVREACEGIELADSITGDAHKCLNVPYDCGFFLTHSIPLLNSIFQNPNAAYLSTSSTTPNPTSSSPPIPSPLNIGIENSRRFRALPVYSVLISHGRAGLAEMLARQVRLARRLAAFISAHRGYELLPSLSAEDVVPSYARTHIIVLFRAVDADINRDLAARICRSGRVMASGTAWEGAPAVRIAVSTWRVEVERDLAVVREVLEEALR